MTEMWLTIGAMAPYLLLGFLVAGILSVTLSQSFVEKHLGQGKVSTVFKASLLGIPLPLCSCGVIPVAASLRKHGASRGATTAFLMSTPQTGIDSLMVTYSLLGPIFAIYRPLVALLSGILGGMMVTYLAEDEIVAKEDESCTDGCCAAYEESAVKRALRYGFYTLPRDIGSSLLLGLAIAGLIAYLVPANFFAQYFTSPFLSMVIMLLCGIPLYVCATASVPVAAALLAKGVTPGAVLVFLMTGPATNAAAITTIWKTMGKRTALLFLLAVVISAFAAGIGLDLIVQQTQFTITAPCHDLASPYFTNGAALLLIFILLYALLAAPKKVKVQATANSLELAVGGMTCSHCEALVVSTLKAVANVEEASASAASGRAIVAGKALSVEQLIIALEKAGHSASLISDD